MAEPKSKAKSLSWLIVSAAVPILGAAGATLAFQAAARSAPGAGQNLLLALGVVTVLVAAGIAVAAKVVEARSKSRLESENETLATQATSASETRKLAVETAKRDLIVLLRDELMKFASTAATMAMQPQELRMAYLQAVARTAAGNLATIVGDHVRRPRAVIYLLSVETTPASMDSIGHGGRGERPRPFEQGTPRGDGAFEFLDRQRTAFYPDLEKDKPNGYDGTMSDYRTFVSVPIWTDNGVYGMVSLDAPDANSFDDRDVALTELVAELMSISFEVGQDQDAPAPEDTTLP